VYRAARGPKKGEGRGGRGKEKEEKTPTLLIVQKEMWVKGAYGEYVVREKGERGEGKKKEKLRIPPSLRCGRILFESIDHKMKRGKGCFPLTTVGPEVGR